MLESFDDSNIDSTHLISYSDLPLHRVLLVFAECFVGNSRFIRGTKRNPAPHPHPRVVNLTKHDPHHRQALRPPPSTALHNDENQPCLLLVKSKQTEHYTIRRCL